MTLLPPTDAQLKAAAERRAILEAQRLAYMARDRGPGSFVQRQVEGIEGAAKVAPKPLEPILGRLLETARARRRRVVREAGRPISSGGVAEDILQNSQKGAIAPQSPPGLKLHPSLAMAAMKAKVDRQYRVWVIARSLPDAGSGRVKVVDIEALIKHEGINGLSDGTLRRLLRQGSPIFFVVFYQDGEKWLELRGLAAVCEALGVTRLSYLPTLLPTRWAKSLLAFRAACYASAWPAGEEFSNPISRLTIQDLTGVKPRSQRDYDKALGGRLDRQSNSEVTGLPLKAGYEIPVKRGYYVDKVELPDGREEIALFKRMPNSYRLPGFVKGGWGMCGVVNRKLKTLSCNEGREARQAKRVYRDHAEAHRRMQRLIDGESILKIGAEFRGRYVEHNKSGHTIHTRITQIGKRPDGRLLFSQ